MSQKMRVLINTPSLNRAGGVSNFYRILEDLLCRQADYFVFAESPGQRRGALRKPLGFLLDCYRFVRLLRARGYDVVHLNPSLSHTAVLRDGCYLLLAKLLRRKVFVLFHGWDLRLERHIEGALLSIFRTVYFRADRIAVLAGQFRDKLIAWGCPCPVDLLTTAVSDGFIDGVLKIQARLERRHFTVLFLARLHKEKGAYETLDAFELLRQRHPEARLIMAGDGPEAIGLRQHAQDHGIQGVHFPGYLRGDNKLRAFAEAHCYIFPTYAEGMPISVLEAMAAGLPLVTRPVGGLRDLLEDGKMGFVTESLQPENLAEHLERLISTPDLCQRMAEYNRQCARDRFVASKVAAQFEAIYREVRA